MSRWLKTCKLVGTSVERDNRGVATETTTERTVVCNPFSMAQQTYFAAQNAGIRPVATIQIHKCEYNGERAVIYDGALLDVERVDATSPDFVRLTLVERLADHGKA